MAAELEGPRHVISSEKYVELGITDMWQGLSLVEMDHIAAEGDSTDQSFTFDDSRIVIQTRPLSFRDRVKLLFSNALPAFHYEVIEKAIVDTEAELGEIPDESIRRLNRHWVLEGTNYSSSKEQPTPREQGQKALELARDHKREHRPELIEAIKALPKASELLIKLPREIDSAEKRRIRNIVLNIINKRPIQVKVVL